MRRSRRSTAAAAVLGGCLLGCTPALDWREVALADSGLLATFPCRPQREERTVGVADDDVRMALFACRAEGSTYALS